MFKYVRVPAPIKLGEAEKGVPFLYSLFDGVTFLVDHAPQFARPQSKVRSGARLVAAFDGAIEGALVEVKQDDWQTLHDVVEAGETPWGVWQSTFSDEAGKALQRAPLDVAPRTFLTFANAITEAVNEDPTKAVRANGTGAEAS